MDNQDLKGLLSQLIPDELENRLGLGNDNAAEQHTRMISLLKTTAGQAGGDVENEMNDFLSGRGALLETTRAAVARGGTSAASEVADFLTKQLHLAAPLAKLIAPILINIFPAIGQVAGATTTEKPRRRRKKKEDSSDKPTHKPHKPKPSSSAKPAASHKPTSHKPARPKPSASSAKPHKPKPSSSKPKPRRTSEIDTGTEE